METSEREMVRKINQTDQKNLPQEKFTSLQPTYEDMVPPDSEEDWEYED